MNAKVRVAFGVEEDDDFVPAGSVGTVLEEDQDEQSILVDFLLDDRHVQVWLEDDDVEVVQRAVTGGETA